MVTQTQDPRNEEPDDPESGPPRYELLYTRRNGRICGPYPDRQIRSFLILGRLDPQDFVSADGEHWTPIGQYPRLVPEVLLDSDSPEGRQRLEQARLREDERLRERRRDHGPPAGRDQRRGDRRCPEPPEIVNHRRQWAELLRYPQPPWQRWVQGPRPWVVGGIAIAVALLVLIVAGEPPDTESRPDCTAPAAPEVNWNYCDKAGADLRDADLSGASLQSTNLAGARLHRARLQGADLRFAKLSLAGLEDANLAKANLTGADLARARLQNASLEGANLTHAKLLDANLDQARLTRARLDRAIWTDGRMCARGSVGRCD